MNIWNYNIIKHNQICVNCDVPIYHPNFYKEIWRYFKDWIVNYAFTHIEADGTVRDLIFVTTTQNNTRSLKPIWSQLDKHSFSVIGAENERDIPYYRWKLVAGYSLLYLYPLLKCYRNASDWEKQIMRNDSYPFFMTMGVMKLTDRLMARNHIRLAVMANDHAPIQMAWKVLAPSHNVQTMYLQHCSVTEKFPPLQFTYSFLDGEESLEKYLHIGDTKGTIYVSGSPRFDCVNDYYMSRKPTDKIGLAINEEDRESLVMDLCEKLHTLGYNQIVLRPHPRQTLHEIKWYKEHGVEISNSKVENPFEYLGRIKILIASESGIHLDAAMMGVYSICYSLTGRKAIDWYSYIKNGLVPNAETETDLIRLLQVENIPSVDSLRSKAQWYNASYGRDTDGHVGDVLADFLRHYLEGSIAEFDRKYGFVIKEQTENYTIKVYDK